MNIEELAKKLPLKEIREEAKKYKISTCRATKLELLKRLPKEAIEELSRKVS